MRRQHITIDEIRISKLAYTYWQARGRPWGSPEIDWLAAEKTLGCPLGSELLMPGEPRGPDEGEWG
jgi:Protein of unknown function (DUF2934)